MLNICSWDHVTVSCELVQTDLALPSPHSNPPLPSCPIFLHFVPLLVLYGATTSRQGVPNPEVLVPARQGGPTKVPASWEGSGSGDEYLQPNNNIVRGTSLRTGIFHGGISLRSEHAVAGPSPPHTGRRATQRGARRAWDMVLYR